MIWNDVEEMSVRLTPDLRLYGIAVWRLADLENTFDEIHVVVEVILRMMDARQGLVVIHID
jgi:hypothetical protein